MEGLFSPQHWIIVIAIALVLFGPKRMPEIARSLGKSIREFKSSVNETPAGGSERTKELPAEIKSESGSSRVP